MTAEVVAGCTKYTEQRDAVGGSGSASNNGDKFENVVTFSET